MTNTAFVLSVLAAAGALAWGYASQGLVHDASRLLIFGALWLFAKWRGWKWMPSLGLLVIIAAAAYGLWIGLALGWMALGALGSLLAWDLAEFARRLQDAAPTDDVIGMERRHLARVGLVALFGGTLALIALIARL